MATTQPQDGTYLAGNGWLKTPAEGRSGYCAYQYKEYDRGMSAYRSAKHAFKQPETSASDPGDREQFEAAIQFTPLNEMWTALGPTDRARIRGQLMDEATAFAFLPPFVVSDEAYNNTDEPELRRLVARLLEVHARTITQLANLADEPEP